MAMDKKDTKEKKEFLPSFLNKKKDKETETEDKSGFENSKPFESRLPGINMIPQSVLDGYALRAYQGKLIKIVVILVVCMLVLGAGLFAFQKITELRLAKAQEEEQMYAQEITKLQPYETYKNDVESKSSTIGSKMATEIDTGKVSKEIRVIAKRSGVKLDTTSISVNTGESANAISNTGGTDSSCVRSSPFGSSPSVGCLTFSGNGDRTKVSKFLSELEKETSFNNAFVPKTSSGTESDPTFEGTVNFSGEFLTNNYSDMTGAQETPEQAPEDGTDTPPTDEENGVTP